MELSFIQTFLVFKDIEANQIEGIPLDANELKQFKQILKSFLKIWRHIEIREQIVTGRGSMIEQEVHSMVKKIEQTSMLNEQNSLLQ